jgi:hypothetical protein
MWYCQLLMRENMTPTAAFDLHTDYLNWRAGHPNDDRILHDGYFRALTGGENAVISMRTVDEVMKRSVIYHNIARMLDDVVLQRADTIFLSDDLRALVNAAEATMPDEVLFETDVYTPCGLVVLESPIEISIPSWAFADDIDHLIEAALKHGGEVTGTRLYTEPENGRYVGYETWNIQAFSWGDEEAVNTEVHAEVRKRFGDNSAEEILARRFWVDEGQIGMHARVYGSMMRTDIDGISINVPALRKAPLHLIDQFSFVYGENGTEIEDDSLDADSWTETDSDAFMANESGKRHRATRRFLVALLRLMEEYVEIDKSMVPRQTSRRASRSERTGDTKNVTTLSLRRALYDDETGEVTGVKITLAHLVRGHWRRQWYPSQQTHRAKWIRPHRRGGLVGDMPTAKPRIVKVDR